MMAPEQCASLHGFIQSIPLIETLHEMRPALGGSTMEESALSSKKREGYEECMSNMLNLANRGSVAPIASPFIDVSVHDRPVTPQEAAA